MVDWVVSRRVNESCYVGSLTRRGPSWVVLFNKSLLKSNRYRIYAGDIRLNFFSSRHPHLENPPMLISLA